MRSIKRSTQGNADRKYIPLMIQGFAAALIAFISTLTYGPGVTHDSAAYIYAAESLLSGKGMIYFGYGTPFVQWPPLFPAMLAVLGGLMGLGVIAAAQILNAAAAGLTVFCSAVWLAKNLRNRSYVLLGQAAVLFSAPLFYVSRYVWTETIFVLFTVLFFIKMHDFRTEDKHGDLVLASIFAALACLARYSGITVIASGIIMMLLGKKRMLKRIKNAMTFGFIAALPLVLWMARNWIVFSTPAGSRVPSQRTFWQNLRHTASTVASWFVPQKNSYSFAAYMAVAAVMFAAVGVLIILAWRYARQRNPAGIYGKREELARSIALPCALPGIFTVTYLAYLIVSATMIAIDEINDRLLVPVYIPIIFCLFVLADNAGVLIASYFGGRFSRTILAAVICIWMLYPIWHTGAMAAKSFTEGTDGYFSSGWRRSELIGYLKEHRPDCAVYSNYPDALYLLTGIWSRYTPKKNGQEAYGLSAFQKSIEKDGYAYIVWLDRYTANYIYNIDELGRYFEIDTLKTLSDGKIFLIKVGK